MSKTHEVKSNVPKNDVFNKKDIDFLANEILAEKEVSL